MKDRREVPSEIDIEPPDDEDEESMSEKNLRDLFQENGLDVFEATPEIGGGAWVNKTTIRSVRMR